MDIINNYQPDIYIVITALAMFGLSVIMAIILYHLPIHSWVFTSVFGIIYTVSITYLFVWLPRGVLMRPSQAWGDLFINFAFAMIPLTIEEWVKYRRMKRAQSRAEGHNDNTAIGAIFMSMQGINAKSESILAVLTYKTEEKISRN